MPKSIIVAQFTAGEVKKVGLIGHEHISTKSPIEFGESYHQGFSPRLVNESLLSLLMAISIV